VQTVEIWEQVTAEMGYNHLLQGRLFIVEVAEVEASALVVTHRVRAGKAAEVPVELTILQEILEK
jgi:hypothetical protein